MAKVEHGHNHLEPILAQVRRIPELKESLRVVLADWARRLEEALKDDHGPEQVQAVADEMKTHIDEVFGALVEGTPVDPNNPFASGRRSNNPNDPNVKVLQRDPSGFARVTETVPGAVPLSGDQHIEREPAASQKLPDSLANQVPTGESANVGKQLENQAKSGQPQATSASDVQHNVHSAPVQPAATTASPVQPSAPVQPPAAKAPTPPASQGTTPNK